MTKTVTKTVTKTKVKEPAARPAKGKAAPVKAKAAPKSKPKPKAKAAAKPQAAKPVKKARTPRSGGTAKSAKKELPEILRDAVLTILDERQAEDIATFDVRGQSALADYIIIASGRNARQLAAMADYAREAFYKAGGRAPRIEGLPQGDWVLVDGGDVILHLFRPEVRSYYNLEDIWARSAPRKA